MKAVKLAVLALPAFASLMVSAAPLDDVNQYADRCAAQLGAGAGAYLPIGILPTPDNFSDSQEVPVFWNQKRITFQETAPLNGAPRPGSGHWEFLFDGMPGAVGSFPDGANTVGRILEGNRQDLKCDFWSHVQAALDACVGGANDGLTCPNGAADCPGGACRFYPDGLLSRPASAAARCRYLPQSRRARRPHGMHGRRAVRWRCRVVPGHRHLVVCLPATAPSQVGASHVQSDASLLLQQFRCRCLQGRHRRHVLVRHAGDREGLTKDGWWKDAAGMPSGLARPGGKDRVKKDRAKAFWETPAQVRYDTDPKKGENRCTACHGNGPILTSRWINQGAVAGMLGDLFSNRISRSIAYWHPAKLLPDPFFKRTQCGESCHNAWSVSANTMPGGNLAKAMTTNPPPALASNYRLQIDNTGAAFARTCRGRGTKEGQPCTVDADCGGAPAVCRAGQNAGILLEMPHRFAGTPAEWATDVKPSYDAMTGCLRVCAGGLQAGKACAEDAECPGSTCPMVAAGVCADTAQATIPAFLGAQSVGPPPSASQFILPPFPPVNAAFARANCMLAADGSETCDYKAQWQDPTAGESDYFSADKYYLVKASVANQAGEAPSTFRFRSTTNVEANAAKAPNRGKQLGHGLHRHGRPRGMHDHRATGVRRLRDRQRSDANDAHSPVDSRNDGDAQKGTLFTACANAVQATRSGYRLNRATQRYVQTVTLKNNGTAPVIGPVTYLLFHLSPNARLFGASGMTSTIVPAGTPYVNVAIGAGNVLNPGDTATLTLQFENPTNQGITYDARVRTGAGEL